MNKFATFPALLLLAMLTLFCQCSRENRIENDSYGSDFPQTKEAFAVIDSSMSFMNSDPAKSHRIIDSVSNAKLMSPQRCDLFHATVIFNGENNPDSALAICNRLLEEENFGDDSFLEEEICVLASNITLGANQYLETLKYAERGIKICHGHELMQSDEAALITRVGQAEQALGRIEQARKTYEKAQQLVEEDKTFGGLIGRISLMKRQIELYSEAHDYDNAIAVCHEVLDLVARFDREPSIVEQRPETMVESGSATRDFADFYESQMFTKIARTYRMKIEEGIATGNDKADRDSLNKYLDKWDKTATANSPENLANVMQELYFTGRKMRFNEAKNAVAELYKSDSLVTGYVEYLNLLAEDAASNQDYKQSNSYLKRALALSDSIRQRETLRTLSEQMAINKVQEYQLARQDAENLVARHRLANWLLGIILLIIIGAGIVIFTLKRRNREKELEIEETKQDLVESQEEIKELAQQLEKTRTERTHATVEGIYEQIVRLMEEQQIYLNPDLDVKLMAEELNSSRTHISNSINRMTGKPFRQWLSEYRLAVFVKLLEENPEVPIHKLMEQCGYKEQSTFRRQFKATYGLTPGDFKRELDKRNQK